MYRQDYNSNSIRRGPADRPLKLAVWLAATVLAIVLAACGDKSSGGGNNNGPIPCESEEDCPPGWICEGNICQPADAGQPDVPTLVPIIHVVPTELDFGSPLLGVEETRLFEISNEGDGDLVVDRIEVLEPGSLKEYTTTPEGMLNLVIPPGDRTEVQVSLVSVDAELDTGQVRISSNDPVTPEVLVNLESEYKGIPDLEACVFSEDASPPYPTHPFTECETNIQGDPVIDYEIVQFQVPEERVLVVYNIAQGNHPLSITDVTVTNTSGHANTYTIELFTQDPNSGDATPAVLPVYLSAGDQTTAPDLMYIRVAFDASVDVFPTEQLVINSNDPNAGQTFIDIIGVVTGCPDDYWDINGDPNDGCEYHCVFQQTTEDCSTAGIDDNCNGETDEEGADNCVVYYRDHDGDNFGDPTDSRCLCAIDGEYNTTDNQDCDDNLIGVNPNAPETCATAYDDNCDGNDNDDNAAQCVTYYRDEDGDGFGLNSDTRCLCHSEGLYTTTTGNDCDDDPSQCGASCNPNETEACTSPVDYDNDCDGTANEQNAVNCTTYYRDLDGDTYGDPGTFQCWCAPSGNYNTTDFTDCDDNPAQCGNNCYPGNTEVCDGLGRDNDCDGVPDSVEFNFNSNPIHCGQCNNVCTASPQSSCGETGTCDTGSCELWPFGTVCVQQTCAGSTQQNADICNGVGGCWDQGQTNCSPYMCDGAGFACRTSCTLDSHCISTHWCNGSGVCEQKKSNGILCNGDEECQSGNCVDGYCCNSTCTGACRACNIATHLGQCWNHAADTDPESECAGICRSCNGSGACYNTAQGEDNEGECPITASDSCGTTGVCAGNGACEYWPSGTFCGSQYCHPVQNWIQVDTSFCDGGGTCVPSSQNDCSPYVCENNICRTDCANDLDCRTGYNCLSSSICCQPLGAGSGNTCGGGTLESDTHNQTTPVTYNYTGRISPTDDENWYRFRVTEDTSHRVNFAAWFISNPGQEFRLVVYKTDSGTICSGGVPHPGCGGNENRCFWTSQTCPVTPPDTGPCDVDQSRTFYVGVMRASGFGNPTCSQYSLRVRIGGSSSPVANCN